MHVIGAERMTPPDKLREFAGREMRLFHQPFAR